MMGSFGVAVAVVADTFRVSGGQAYRPTDIQAPGDFSSAAFPLGAAAITDGDVPIEGLDPESPDGDRRLVDLLRSFGARVETAPDRVRVRSGDLVGLTGGVGDPHDLLPDLAPFA